jgi:exonuclease III
VYPSDASVHRLISDLSIFATKKSRQSLLVAGDLNVLYGHGEGGDAYWATRYETVFARMAALGLKFVGPQAPRGRRADPWPDELPRMSNNVPTYYAKHQTPATCTRQLDFVFASARLAERINVTALNEPDEWGPSDHCRVAIQVT